MTPSSARKALESSVIRKQFPALAQRAHGQPLVYLDNAATTQKPLAVIEAIDRYYRESNANVHRASHFLSARSTHAFEEAREKVKAFINAAWADEIIWTRGATEALNLVALSWGRASLNKGDEILLSVMEHHANIVPWQMVAQQTGALIRVIDIDDSGELDLHSFRSQLSDKTRLVSVTHVSNAIGTINPVQTIIDEAHTAGALVLVDGSQAVAHSAVDVQQLGCDFYVFSGHKVFGPTGIGVLYGQRELLDAMPPWQTGGEMIERVSFNGTTFNSLPFKFEAGTPNVAGAIGLAAAIDFLGQFDLASVAHHEQNLRLRAEQGLNQLDGIRLIGQAGSKVAVVSCVHEQLHNQDIGLLLDQQGIAVRTGHHCTMPLMERLGLPGTVRASFSLYNTTEDVDRFLNAMKQLVAGTGRSKPVNNRSVDDSPFAACSMQEGQELRKRLLKSRSWQDKYRLIMLLGKDLPALPEDWRTEQSRLHGCESKVWLHHHYEEETMRLHFAADSDARVIRGLIALLLSVFSGRTPEEISAFDIESYFAELNLMNHLSPSRGNGLMAIVREIQSLAHRYG